MSDLYGGDARAPRLVPYYTVFAPARFKNADGSPVKRRTQQILAKKLRLPLIRCGWTVLIDEAAGDRRLAEHAEHQDESQRRRGRPRTGG